MQGALKTRFVTLCIYGGASSVNVRRHIDGAHKVGFRCTASGTQGMRHNMTYDCRYAGSGVVIRVF